MTRQRRPRLFAWAEGQESNLGDSVLRRGLLRRLPLDGAHVYIGRCGPDYLSAVPLPTSAVLYRSLVRWHVSAIASAMTRPTHVVMSAGEAIADRRSIPMRLAFAVTAALARRTGGGVHQTGVGVRRPLGRWSAPLKWSVRRAQLVTWRDDWSRSAMGVGSVAPDWAFGERGAADGERRDRIAVALRGDRAPVDDSWVSFLRGYADANKLGITVVSQVRADTDLARDLAARLDAEIVAPTCASHAEQERQVRAAYARAEIVLSDRLHGLVIALTEGALPVAGGPSSTEKSQRTLEAAGIPVTAIGPKHVVGEALPATEAFDGIRARRPEVLAALAAAEATLADLGARLRATVGSAEGADGGR